MKAKQRFVKLSAGVHFLARLIWPPSCKGCRCLLTKEEEFFCAACLEDLEWIGSCCQKCGLPKPAGVLQGEGSTWICEQCGKKKWAFAFACSALHNQGRGKKLLKEWKLLGQVEVGVALQHLFATYNQERLLPWIEQQSLVVPLPMGYLRRFGRGFDQAVALAEAWAKPRELQVESVLYRAKSRKRQIHQTREQRQKGWEGVFKVKKKWHRLLQEKPVILIDDVMTTGASLQAAALALKQAGCPDVAVVTLLREV